MEYRRLYIIASIALIIVSAWFLLHYGSSPDIVASTKNPTSPALGASTSNLPYALTNLGKAQDAIRKEGLAFFERQFQKPTITNLTGVTGSTVDILDGHKIDYKEHSDRLAYYVDGQDINDNALSPERFNKIVRISTSKIEADMLINVSMGSCACSNIVFLYPSSGKIKLSDYYQQWYEAFDNTFTEKILAHSVLTDSQGRILLARLDAPFFIFMGSNPSVQTVQVPILFYLDTKTGTFARYSGSSQENEAITQMYLKLSQDMEAAINEYDKSPDKYLVKVGYYDFPNILGFKFGLDRLGGLSYDESIKNMSADYLKLTKGASGNSGIPSLEEVKESTLKTDWR